MSDYIFNEKTWQTCLLIWIPSIQQPKFYHESDQANESEFISVLQILIILIQHKYLNHESYSLYFGPNILSHYEIDKNKDMADKPTNFDAIRTSNTNCANAFDKMVSFGT